MRVLLLGCGHRLQRNIVEEGQAVGFENDDLTTLDMDPSANPDLLFDLDKLPCGGRLPFDDNTFDELHAYDVLEHVGVQGDWRGYFTEFAEYHRILKPGGKFYITVPIGADAIADPGHTRFFSLNHFGFLSQIFYTQNRGMDTTCTDYRWYWKLNFDVLFLQPSENHHIGAILRKA